MWCVCAGVSEGVILTTSPANVNPMCWMLAQHSASAGRYHSRQRRARTGARWWLGNKFIPCPIDCDMCTGWYGSGLGGDQDGRDRQGTAGWTLCPPDRQPGSPHLPQPAPTPCPLHKLHVIPLFTSWLQFRPSLLFWLQLISCSASVYSIVIWSKRSEWRILSNKSKLITKSQITK